MRTGPTIYEKIEYLKDAQQLSISDRIRWMTDGDAHLIVDDEGRRAYIVYDGEFNFTRINGAHFLVSTNFNLANHSHGGYPCPRYTTATSMLSAMTSEEDLTVEACRDVLDAVHNEGTIYSNIFDPVNRRIFLYQNHNYEDLVTLNLDTELALVHPGGIGVIQEDVGYYREVLISDLFAPPIIPHSLILGIGGAVIFGVVVITLVVWRNRKPT